MKNRVYVIFGAGNAGKELAGVFPEPISYFVDNDPKKWGTHLNGILINKPEKLLQENKDNLRIFIASIYFDQIKSQLDAMQFENKKHYFNIVPYYSLLNKRNFLDTINLRLENTNKHGRKSLDFVDRLQLIFEIQEEFVSRQDNNRILIVVDSRELDANWVERVQYWLKELFKLKVLLTTIDISAKKDKLEGIARKYKSLGYSRLLYLGQDSSDIEALGKLFDYFYSVNQAFNLCDKKSWIDYMYHIVTNLGFIYKKVSVVVPNYNYDQYLCRRLRTIIDQQYPIYEILFLDDASSDESVIIAESLLEEYCGLKQVIINNKNSGSVFKQWKKGIEAMQGDYIWIAEADDYASPLMLSNLMMSFVTDKNVVMSFCDSMFVDSKGEWEGFSSDARVQLIQDDGLAGGIYDGKEFVRQYLSEFNPMPNVSAVVMKRASVRKNDLEKTSAFKQAGDWYFYLRMLMVGKVAYHMTPMNFFRRQSRAATINMNLEEHQQELNIVARTIEKILHG
jgi:hypothetical protein